MIKSYGTSLPNADEEKPKKASDPDVADRGG